MTGAEIVALDALTLLVVVDNESDILSSVDPGVPKLSEVTHLLERAPIALTHGRHHGQVVFDQLCWACHGLSVLVTASGSGETRSALFDVGPDGELWLSNAERLGVGLATIEVVFLSHWHFDHSGGLPTVLAAIAAGPGRGRVGAAGDRHAPRASSSARYHVANREDHAIPTRADPG